jgi:2-phospho-L-lactate/phosphoenolpyruvate guanylyltransferase
MTRKVVAVIPVGDLERAKSRLGEVLDAEERRDLVLGLLERTLAATIATPGIDETIVVTPDDEVAGLATAAGARIIRQADRGLNRGLDEARAAALAGGATALIVLPADLPNVSPAAVGALLEVLDEGSPPLVAIVPDRHGRGTNGLLLAPPGVIDFAFGGDSREAHRHAAAAACTRVVELDGPLALDVDTPEDLLLVQAGELGATDGS